MGDARVRPATVLPKDYVKTLPARGAHRIVVPAGALLMAEIARPTAAMRSGPGPQYELADRVLIKGAKVLVLGRLGVWRKVIVQKTGASGWVHVQTLGERRTNDKPYMVDTSRLPIVLALRPVAVVRAFKGKRPMKAAIPKGAMFRSLRLAAAEALVWIPETNSVMWVSRKDVQ